MNIFELAGLELVRENKNPNNLKDLLSRAVTIRRWLDKHKESVANRIMAGDTVYQYAGAIKTYTKAI